MTNPAPWKLVPMAARVPKRFHAQLKIAVNGSSSKRAAKSRTSSVEISSAARAIKSIGLVGNSTIAHVLLLASGFSALIALFSRKTSRRRHDANLVLWAADNNAVLLLDRFHTKEPRHVPRRLAVSVSDPFQP